MLCLMGAPELLGQDSVRSLELPEAPLLLAYATLVDEPRPRSKLADFLFAEAPNPRDSLRWYLSYLRCHLPDALVLDRETVSSQLATNVAAFVQTAADRPDPDRQESDCRRSLPGLQGRLPPARQWPIRRRLRPQRLPGLQGSLASMEPDSHPQLRKARLTCSVSACRLAMRRHSTAYHPPRVRDPRRRTGERFAFDQDHLARMVGL